MTLEQLQEQLTRAYEAQNAGKYDETIRLANDVLAITTDPALRAEATRMLGIVAWRQGEHTSALEHYATALEICEQAGIRQGIAVSCASLGHIYYELSDYPPALEYLERALGIAEELGKMEVAEKYLGNIGLIYWACSDYFRALEYLSKALQIAEAQGNTKKIASQLGNMGTIYWNLSEFSKSLEYYGKALALTEEVGNRIGAQKWMGNIGIIYSELADYSLAMEYLNKALVLADEFNDTQNMSLWLGNIGNVYRALHDFPNALFNYGKALELAVELGNKQKQGIWLGNIGTLYSRMDFIERDPTLAEDYLLRAINLCSSIGEKFYLYHYHKSLADLYKEEKRWEECQYHFEKYHDIEKEVQSEEIKQQAERLDFERKQAERDKNLAVERAKHEATEQLLHNVLPPSIAHRMLAGESLIAEKLSNVSVLFADIVNFTNLSQRITAEELVAGLDRIFTSFDTLAEKHGLEKIKTIGDAYMVVSGAPEPREDHAEVMALMALEMLEAMKEFRSISTGKEIQIRVGIHSGEVVAGVIGKKKFAYDLWGDAVNTASRMESHGEAGKIHVSEEFVRELKVNSEKLKVNSEKLKVNSEKLKVNSEKLKVNSEKLKVNSEKLKVGKEEQLLITINSSLIAAFPRGEMEIKGKGMMKTYFLEKN